MKLIIMIMSKLLEHIYNNVSSYLMLLGFGCILSYVYSTFGFQASLLLTGILLIIISVMIELNKPVKRGK